MKLMEGTMSRLKFKIMPIAAAGLLCAFQLADAASSQPIPIEAENRAKLSRLKAKGGASSRSAFSAKKSSGSEDEDECNIGIGNVDTGGRGRGPREVNIFITEPIFQVNNRCR